MDQATKILENIAKTAATVVLDPSTKAIISNVQDIEGQTRVIENLSEDQKKDLKHGTTIIGSNKKRV